MKKVADAGGAKDTKGLAPDDWDEKNIRNLIEMWCKVHPRGRVRYLQDPKEPKRIWVEYLNPYDHLEYMRSVVKQDRKLNTAMQRKTDTIVLTTSLPPGLADKLHRGYPTLLTDKRQTAWFLRKFPEFKL